MISKHRFVIYVLKYKSQLVTPIALEFFQPEAEIFEAMIRVLNSKDRIT
jgi:hypothetical protein